MHRLPRSTARCSTHYPDRSERAGPRRARVRRRCPGWRTDARRGPRARRAARRGAGASSTLVEQRGRRPGAASSASAPSATTTCIWQLRPPDDPALLDCPRWPAVFSDAARFGRWLEVELLATEAHADARHRARGRRRRLPASARRVVDEAFVAGRRRTRGGHRPRRRRVRRRRAGGDRRAGRRVDPLRADVAATSVDTALCWMLRDAADLLIDASTRPADARWSSSPATHRDTVMIGRTHGIHAEPTTFGAKVALWALQVDRDRDPPARGPRHRRGDASSAARSARTRTSIRRSSAFVGDALGLRAGAGHPGDRPRPPRRVPLRVRVDRRDDAS